MQVGMAAALAAGSVRAAQQVENAQAPPGAPPGPAPLAASLPLIANPLKIDAYSRHLQWLRTADEVSEAVIEMGYTGLDITVMPYPGHVDPTAVAQQLPPFVNTVRKHGLGVRTIRCPITDADSANAEQILQTASSLGITHYWGLGLRYAADQPIMKQLDGFKSTVARIAALNAKYKMTGMYHTYSGDMTVGAAVWDLLYLFKDLDPANIGFHYDFGHMTNAGGNSTWAVSLRAAAPYIAGVSVKDSMFERVIDVSDGGAYAGQPLGGFGGGAPGGRGAGAGGPGAAAAGGAAGAPAAANAQSPGGSPAAQQDGRANPPAAAQAGAPAAGGAPDAAGGGRGGRGRGGGFAGPGGPGGRGAAPGRGGGGQTNPWRIVQVPLGEGQDDLPKLATILREINFSGPVEIQAEYPNGGAGNAADKITLPPAQVLGAMKRDRLVLEAAFHTAGLL
jgi:sugar phosphate isomerase/epimerase